MMTCKMILMMTMSWIWSPKVQRHQRTATLLHYSESVSSRARVPAPPPHLIILSRLLYRAICVCVLRND